MPSFVRTNSAAETSSKYLLTAETDWGEMAVQRLHGRVHLRGAEHKAADAAEPVDANLEDHRDGSVVAVPSRDAPRCAASG